MSDLAYWFKMQPSEIDRVLIRDLMRWHEQAVDYAKRYSQ